MILYKVNNVMRSVLLLVLYKTNQNRLLARFHRLDITCLGQDYDEENVIIYEGALL